MTGPAEGARGTLVLVVGPSGVGKDSLIDWCRARIGRAEGVIFPRRVVTRPAGGGGEDYDAITEDGFATAIAAGAFALHWRAHGLSYGIPKVAADDLAAGRHVVVNVSRAMIDEARRRFPPVTVISVTAPAGLLAERLGRRGRETETVIGERLARAETHAVSGAGVIILDNSGPIEDAGERLMALLCGLPRRRPQSRPI